ncbi:MAG: dipicolinate synthase subunit B, partial [Clostridiales bacterium]|nr:dipicolinate synthase subunit B [Clostridiales bacterium]
KNIYFVPFGQDDFVNKANSLVADFSKIYETVRAAEEGKQIQPVLLSGYAK